MDSRPAVPKPYNEPVRSYAPGTNEQKSLQHRLSAFLSDGPADLTHTVAGRQFVGNGDEIDVVRPDRHEHVLGRIREATAEEVAQAVEAARAAAPGWRETLFAQRAAVLLRAADLLSGPWRDTLNAATMLGQSKTCYQAEIDAACELADFWRWNVGFAEQVYDEHPASVPGTWNRLDQRSLEGFVLAITPFNFTAISGNLPTAPALMGNTVVWKPSPTQALAAHHTLRLLEAAGLPPGVINLVHGTGPAVSDVALTHPDLAGVHFTGSTATFQHLWRTVGEHIDGYRTYPRLVGETGGKDFVIAHASADPDALVVALLRGAFEYQGQKCSAASRAYVPKTLWQQGVREALVAGAEEVAYGDVTDWTNFGGAVIDRRAFERLRGVLGRLRDDPTVEVLAGGTADDRDGYFVQPTIVVCADPAHEVFTTEFFGPVLAVRVYDEAEYAVTMLQAADAAPYALTGAFFATDRVAIEEAQRVLRFSAGNFYINDKPTGAVVGQQPFGGGRASGTNDKAGSVLNLLRWTSPRSIKESTVPARDWRYPHQGV
ncbi:MAG TPA: L-glutamate gamma-semialdehyde dehydrogenase [Mycobacteriales bacterium]